ncbi:hypothetical protein, partial [Sinorhizobium fredii]|uniref:hypothetical protein n=3 Tax=Rhizobium fredii TaxID=380 RepID=UPI0024E08614
ATPESHPDCRADLSQIVALHSVFARATVTATTVEWVSFRESSDDSGFESTPVEHGNSAIGFISPLLLEAQIEERAQSNTEMKP